MNGSNPTVLVNTGLLCAGNAMPGDSGPYLLERLRVLATPTAWAFNFCYNLIWFAEMKPKISK